MNPQIPIEKDAPRNHFGEIMDIIPTPEADKIITVEVSAADGCCLDGHRVPKGKTVKISVKQWRALSRHFRFLDGPSEHAPKGHTPPTATRNAS